MDPTGPTVSFLLSLLANATWAGKNALIRRRARGSGVGCLTGNPENARLLDAALARYARELPEGTDADTRHFFVSPELQLVIRQLFAATLLEVDTHSAIRNEFVRIYSLYFPHRQVTEEETRHLFASLVQAIDAALDDHVESRELRTQALRFDFRFQLLRDELAGIGALLKRLAEPAPLDIGDINKWAKEFKREFGRRSGKVRPPFFAAEREVAIDDIYVPGRFRKLPTKQTRHYMRGLEAESSIQDFEEDLYRVVVLGDPGGGKSTLAQWLCHRLCETDQHLLPGRSVTPFLVVLRDYAPWAERSEKATIVDFLESEAAASYQRPAPAGAVDYLMCSGRAFVVFDGLDELLDTSRRRQVADAIESFATLYPNVPILATSRVVGYNQAPLSRDIFTEYKLTEFSETEVDSYANKWFSLDHELSVEDRKRNAHSFVVESAVADDVRANPLMLGLMCNIYKGEGDIPKNRPTVYQKCAEMLFERWDKRRGIRHPLPFEYHIAPAIDYLAFWMYTDQRLQSGVPEHHLAAKTSDFLEATRFSDRTAAEGAAKEFVEFCRGRAWVLTEAGLTPEGEGLYRFTHRTFMEYFAARHVVGKLETTEELFNELLPRIKGEEWDVVAQLAFQIKSRAMPGGPGQQSATDMLLDKLITASENGTADETLSCLSFAVRCLAFMVPTADVCRRLVNSGVRAAVALGRQTARQRGPRYSRDWSRRVPALAVTLPLADASAENAEGISSACAEAFDVAFESDSTREYTFMLLADLAEVERLGRTGRKLFRRVLESVLSKHNPIVMQGAGKKSGVAQRLCKTGVMSLAEVLEHHGMTAVARPIDGVLTAGTWFAPIFHDLALNRSFAGDSDEGMAAIGAYVAKEGIPILAARDWRILVPDSRSLTALADSRLTSGRGFLAFAVLVYMCLCIEKASIERRPLDCATIKRNSPYREVLYALAAARLRAGQGLSSDDIASRLDLGSRETRLLRQWMTRRGSFIRRPG